MNLPEKFCFTYKGYPGYTHSAKLVDGACYIKTARGFQQAIGFNFCQHYKKVTIQDLIEGGYYILVDEEANKEKRKQARLQAATRKANGWPKVLPNKFKFYNSHNDECSAKIVDNDVYCERGYHSSTNFSVKTLEEWIANGYYKFIEEIVDTPKAEFSPLKAHYEEMIEFYKQKIAAL